VYRYGDGPDGTLAYDVVTTLDDRQPGRPLLQEMMKGGRRVGPPLPLADIRARAQRELASLPDSLRSLDEAPPYDVRISAALRELTQGVDEAG
jgi:nicotinate phosphoribosyltransferase